MQVGHEPRLVARRGKRYREKETRLDVVDTVRREGLPCGTERIVERRRMARMERLRRSGQFIFMSK